MSQQEQKNMYESHMTFSPILRIDFTLKIDSMKSRSFTIQYLSFHVFSLKALWHFVSEFYQLCENSVKWYRAHGCGEKILNNPAFL